MNKGKLSNRILPIQGHLQLIEITGKNFKDIKPEANDPDGYQKIHLAMPAMVICANMERLDIFGSQYEFNLVKDLTMRHAKWN